MLSRRARAAFSAACDFEPWCSEWGWRTTINAEASERSALTVRQVCYLTCLFTSFVISNMLTVALPPNTAFNASSALIIRLFF
jgi:hypothetical protein